MFYFKFLFIFCLFFLFLLQTLKLLNEVTVYSVLTYVKRKYHSFIFTLNMFLENPYCSCKITALLIYYEFIRSWIYQLFTSISNMFIQKLFLILVSSFSIQLHHFLLLFPFPSIFSTFPFFFSSLLLPFPVRYSGLCSKIKWYHI